MRRRRSLSVVVPAYNEGRRVGATLDRIVEHLRVRRAAFEVIVVDDGSTDCTAASADRRAAGGIRVVRLPVNRGKGAAVRRGVLESCLEDVLICDADLSTPIGELERLEERRGESAIVIASRRVPDSTVNRSLLRRAVSSVFSRVLHRMGLCRGIRDTQCGFKLLEGALARRLFSRMHVDGFAFDVELIELALSEGESVREVGVRWTPSRESSVRLGRDVPRMLADVWRVRRRARSEPLGGGVTVGP